MYYHTITMVLHTVTDIVDITLYDAIPYIICCCEHITATCYLTDTASMTSTAYHCYSLYLLDTVSYIVYILYTVSISLLL